MSKDPAIRLKNNDKDEFNALYWMYHAAIYANRIDVRDQIYHCRMPNQGAPALTNAERAAFLAWLVCGAPNN